MATMDPPPLTDDVIFLRPLRVEDGPAHLAGEDDEIAAYLSSGKSTEETVRTYIQRSLEDWRNDGPMRAFGMFTCTDASLVGSIEANLFLPTLKPRQVNISYGVFSEWRGQGIAVRAIRLICSYLRTCTDSAEVIIRTVPSNHASAKVAEKAGFRFEGLRHESEASMLTYSLDLQSHEIHQCLAAYSPSSS
jgi:RimJ/RimL family protein N-acetyltransferase